MLYVAIHSWRPEVRKEIVARFLETGGRPPPGVKLLGRWTDIAGGRTFTVSESDDPTAIGKFAYGWNDLMSIQIIPVMNDEQLGQILAG